MTKETLIVGQFLQYQIETLNKELNRIDTILGYDKTVKFISSNAAIEICLSGNEKIRKMCPKGYGKLADDLKTATNVYYLLLKEAYNEKLSQIQILLESLTDSNSPSIAEAFNIDISK